MIESWPLELPRLDDLRSLSPEGLAELETITRREIDDVVAQAFRLTADVKDFPMLSLSDSASALVEWLLRFYEASQDWAIEPLLTLWRHMALTGGEGTYGSYGSDEDRVLWGPNLFRTEVLPCVISWWSLVNRGDVEFWMRHPCLNFLRIENDESSRSVYAVFNPSLVSRKKWVPILHGFLVDNGVKPWFPDGLEPYVYEHFDVVLSREGGVFNCV
jgi:hypothetical protein